MDGSERSVQLTQRSMRSEGSSGVEAILERVNTRSTEKEMLRQLRDSLNPDERIHTRILLLQALTALVAVVIMVALVIGGYVKLREIRVSVQAMAVSTSELKLATDEIAKKNEELVKEMEPLAVMPGLAKSMQDMSEATDQMNAIVCGSPLFAPQCPPEERGLLAPGASASSPIITVEAEANENNRTYFEQQQANRAEAEAGG